MVAAVTGISRGVNLGVTDLTRATAGGADAGFPAGFVSFDGALDGGSCAYAEDGGAGTTAGNWYSGHVAFSSAIDMSGTKSFAVMHYRVGSSGFNDVRAVRIGLYSGSNLANYAYWEYTVPASAKDGVHRPYLAIGTPTFAAAGWDNSDVTGFIPQVQSNTGDAFAFTHYIDQNLIFGDVQLGDTGAAATVSLPDYYELLKASSSEDYRSLLVKTAGSTVEFTFPFTITAADYNAPAVADGFAFTEPDGVGVPAVAAGFYAASMIPPAGGSQVYSNMAGANNSSGFDLTLDGSAAGCTLTCTSCLFAGVEDVVISGANTTITASSIVGPANVTIGGVDFSGSITGVTNPIQYTSALLSGSNLSTDSDIDVTFDVGDYTASTLTFTASNAVTVDPTTDAGTYNFSSWINTGFTTNFDIPSGNTFDTTIEIAGSFAATRTEPATGGGSITLSQPQQTLTVESNVSALIQIFDFGTQTLLASTTGTSLAYIYSGSPSFDVRVQEVNYYPGYTAVSPTGSLTVPINLTRNNVYQAGSPLTYGVDISYARATQLLTLNTAATVREQFSSLIDAFISEASLYNTDFDFQMNGTTSLFLVNGAEYASDTDAERSRRGGIRYSSAGVVTAEWFGALSTSSIDTSTFQARYQLQIGTGTTNANAPGDIDQVIKVYGDATHGNFDYRSISPRFKMQPNGYYQADFDLHSVYGISATEPVLYVFSLSPTAIPNFTTGDPAITGISFTNNGAAPITRESLSWGALISDTNNNSGEDIQRWWNWNISQGGTFQSEDTFNLPDFIFGAPYQTNLGQIIGAAGSAQRGLWVERPSSTPHPDFFQQQSDSGVFYVLPTTPGIACPNFPKGRVRLTNVTTGTYEQEFTFAAGAFSHTWTNGTDFTAGDEGLIQFVSELENDLAVEFIAPLDGTLTFLNTPTLDGSYDAYGVDGSTVNEFSFDEPNFQFDIDSITGFSPERFWAYFKYEREATAGLLDTFFDSVRSPNPSLIEINVPVLDAYIDNVRPDSVVQNQSGAVGGYIIFRRSDGVYPQIPVTSGGGGVGLYHLGQGFGSEVNTGSGLDPTEKAQLASAASDSAAAVSQNALLVNDQGLNAAQPKVITEVVEGSNYTESVDGVTKTVVRSGSTTTITRTA